MAGNITKIKEGSYRLRYKDYSKYIKAKSDSEAQRLLARFITEIDNGDFTKPLKITFKEFANKWLKEYAEVELAPKTVFRYKQLLDTRIYKVLGNMKLHKIKPLDLLEFYNSLRKKHKYNVIQDDGTIVEKDAEPLSEQTIKHHHRLICAIFEKAIKWGILKGINPAKCVDTPKVEKKKAKCYDEKQVQALLDALEKVKPEDLKYKVATMIALITGARLGEIMGLEWQDINFENKYIEIRQSSQYLPKRGVFIKTPKTEMSRRRVSVNKMLLDLLHEYKEDQENKGFLCQYNKYLFVTWDEKPIHPSSITKWFRNFLKNNNLPPLNFHGLRHTSATFLISKGMDIETVAGRLGHSTSATTHNIYSHFLEAKDKKAADIMEKSFSRRKNKKT